MGFDEKRDGLNGLREAAQTIDDGDQHIVEPAVLELVKNLQPEFGALGLLDSQAQHLFPTIGAYAQRQIHRLIFNRPLVTNL